MSAVAAPIDITLDRDGHTVAVGGGVPILANDEASAQALALRLAMLVRIHTTEVTRFVEARRGGRR